LTRPQKAIGLRPVRSNEASPDGAPDPAIGSSPRAVRATNQTEVQETGVLYIEPAEDNADLSTRTSDRAGVGEAGEMERIARREMPRVEGLLRRMLGPRADLDDLVQNVFLEMCRALPNFRGESSISTFVGGITVRVARRAMRPSAWARFRGPMPEAPPVGPDRPHDNVVAGEQLRRLDIALSKISPDKRVAFVLWAVDGKDVETIATMVGASVPATRSRIHYAQKELKVLAVADPYLKDLVEEGDDA
jgi:RNA polymerase sigma-70 factor (ECF subfamily)